MKMKRNKAIIFDLDGVIVDTAKFHFLAWRKLANDLGFDISDEQNEKLKGVSRNRSLEQILQWGQIQVSQEDFEKYMLSKNEDYLSRISGMDENDLLPGVKEFIDHLNDNNIPFALGSASRNARIILKSLGIYEKFSAIVDGNDVSKAKPDPEVFLLAAEQMKTAPGDCIVFEDSLAGIEAANTAGMTSIAIGEPEILKDADYIFSDFRGISTKFLNELIKR